MPHLLEIGQARLCFSAAHSTLSLITLRFNMSRIRSNFSDMCSVHLDAGTGLPVSQGISSLSFLMKPDRPLSQEHILSWKTIGKLVRGWFRTEKTLSEGFSPKFDSSREQLLILKKEKRTYVCVCAHMLHGFLNRRCYEMGTSPHYWLCHHKKKKKKGVHMNSILRIYLNSYHILILFRASHSSTIVIRKKPSDKSVIRLEEEERKE